MYKNIHGIYHSVASNLENSMSQKKNGRYITFSKHFLAIVFIIPLYIACLIRMSHGNVFPRIKYYLLLTCTSSSWHWRVVNVETTMEVLLPEFFKPWICAFVRIWPQRKKISVKIWNINISLNFSYSVKISKKREHCAFNNPAILGAMRVN